MSVVTPEANLKIEWLIGGDALLFVLLVVVVIIRMRKLEHESLNIILSHIKKDDKYF
ncbi:hypothetical protein ACG99R_004205 [Klebsiella aerogenes]